MAKRYFLALDLKDDPDLIKEYIHYHAPGNVWPEVLDSLSDSGIIHMEIFHTGNRLFMMLETEDGFTFEKKATLDASNTHVLAWEELMWKFQQALPWAKAGQKWVQMEKIFEFDAK